MESINALIAIMFFCFAIGGIFSLHQMDSEATNTGKVLLLILSLCAFAGMILCWLSLHS